MRFLLISTLEMPYRAWLSARWPALVSADYGAQIAALFEDGVNVPATDGLTRAGHTVFVCFVNDGLSQGAWARAHDLPIREQSDPDAVLRRQIAAFAPDVVCLDASQARLAPLVREAAPASILAARIQASDAIPDLSRFNVILTDRAAAIAALQVHGLPVHLARPAFPPMPGSATTAAADVLVRADVRPTDRKTIVAMLALAKAPLGFGGEFTPVFHIHTEDPGALPIGLTMYDQGPLYGAAFREAAAGARIVVDLDDGYGARAHRLLQAIAGGACVLAEDSAAVQGLVPGLATFTTADELVEKVYGFLGDGNAREAYRKALHAAAARQAEDGGLEKIAWAAP